MLPSGLVPGGGGGGSLGRGAKKQAFKGIHGDRTICMRHKAGEVRRRTPPIPGTPPLHSGHPSGDVGPHQSGLPAPGAALYSNVIGSPERQFAGSVWLDLVRAAVGGTPAGLAFLLIPPLKEKRPGGGHGCLRGARKSEPTDAGATWRCDLARLRRRAPRRKCRVSRAREISHSIFPAPLRAGPGA